MFLVVPTVLAVLAAILVFADLDMLRKPDAQIALPTVGEPVRHEMSLAAGTQLSFAMYADKASYGAKPRDDLWLSVELFAGEEMILETRCVGIEGQRERGTEIQTSYYGGDGCKITVPEPGAQAVEAMVYYGKGGAGLSFEGLALKVFARP